MSDYESKVFVIVELEKSLDTESQDLMEEIIDKEWLTTGDKKAVAVPIKVFDYEEVAFKLDADSLRKEAKQEAIIKVMEIGLSPTGKTAAWYVRWYNGTDNLISEKKSSDLVY